MYIVVNNTTRCHSLRRQWVCCIHRVTTIIAALSRSVCWCCRQGCVQQEQEQEHRGLAVRHWDDSNCHLPVSHDDQPPAYREHPRRPAPPSCVHTAQRCSTTRTPSLTHSSADYTLRSLTAEFDSSLSLNNFFNRRRCVQSSPSFQRMNKHYFSAVITKALIVKLFVSISVQTVWLSKHCKHIVQYCSGHCWSTITSLLTSGQLKLPTWATFDKTANTFILHIFYQSRLHHLIYTSAFILCIGTNGVEQSACTHS